MLTKLLKYEFRSIGRQLIPLYLGVLGLAVVNHFLWFTSSVFDIALPEGLSGVPALATMTAYVAVCVALFVITVLLIIQRFYKGLLTEEGYLMFTLPCRPWQLIAAKGVTAAVMTIAGSCAGILSVMLMGLSLHDWGQLFTGFLHIPWSELFRTHALWPLYVVEALLAALVALFGSIGHMYVSIAIGHLFNRRRIAWSIAAYIGINIVISVLLSQFWKILNWPDWSWTSQLSGAWEIHVGLILLIVFNLVPAAIYFFGTNWILTNKLNLE